MARTGGLFWPAAAALACTAGVATLLFTVFTVYWLHVPLPFWDEWSSVTDFRLYDAGHFGLADLAAQHNEHRILFPRLVFGADARFFALSGQLNLTVTLLLQAADVAILLTLVRRRLARRAQLLLLSGFPLLLLFSLRQEQNFTNGYQLQFVGVFTAAALAAAAYLGALERFAGGRNWGSAPFFALAAVWCGVSAYTMANGILAGFVLAIIAILRRASWRVVLATLVLSSLLAGLYLHDYAPGYSSLPLSDVPSHLWAYPRYFTAYIGNPLGSDIRTTQALGVLGLVLAAAAAWHVATGALAGVKLAGPPRHHGICPRQRCPDELRPHRARHLAGDGEPVCDAVTDLLVRPGPVLVSRGVRPRRIGPAAAGRVGTTPQVALGSLMLLLAGASVWFEVSAWPDLTVRSAQLRHVSDSLISGLFDDSVASLYENNTAADIAGYVPYVRSNRMAAFADPAYALAGHILEPAARAGTCPGSVTARVDLALGPDGVRLSGTAPKVAGTAPTRIVLTDAADRVVGFGSASLAGQPSSLWTGYAQAHPGQELRAFELIGTDRFCRLGSAAALEAEPPS